MGRGRQNSAIQQFTNDSGPALACRGVSEGEEEADVLRSVAVHVNSTVSCAAGGPGARPTVSSASGLVDKICAVDVCEIFLPPRVTAEAERFGMHVGDAMDLITGWDFNIPEH